MAALSPFFGGKADTSQRFLAESINNCNETKKRWRHQKTQVIMVHNQTVIYQLNRDDLKELITQVVQDAVRDLQGNEDKTADDGGNDLMTREQVAEYLGVTKVTLSTWAKNGYLPCIHIGRGVRYYRKDVVAFAVANNKR